MSEVLTSYRHKLLYEPEANATRLAWDIKTKRADVEKTLEKFWKDRPSAALDPAVLKQYPHAWLEIGAGSGTFATALGQIYPDWLGIALERCRMRGTRLAKRVERLGTKNVLGLRGNAIATFMRDIPPQSLDRIYILYPCPWPKNSQRKNRWYLHSIMPQMVQSLKPGGWIYWASDQEFYIREAAWISENVYKMKTLAHGPLAPNQYNEVEKFPLGRSKFEADFLQRGQPCHELVSQVVPETVIPA